MPLTTVCDLVSRIAKVVTQFSPGKDIPCESVTVADLWCKCYRAREEQRTRLEISKIVAGRLLSALPHFEGVVASVTIFFGPGELE